MSSRITNTIPNSSVFNAKPNSRVSNFQTTKSGEQNTPAGSPIGLLLSLTYATPQKKVGFYSDFRPTARIQTY